MPRTPTGNPRGRPKGTGHLAAPQRITVWLDGELFARLEAYADGRHFHRGTPELAGCVRELLAHALACPYKEQTRNIPHVIWDINEQTRKSHAHTEDNNKQIENVPEGRGEIIEQTEITLAPAAPVAVAVAEEAVEALPEVWLWDVRDPGYNLAKYVLGPLCDNGHDHQGTGCSVRTIKIDTGKRIGNCLECTRERDRARKARKAALAR